jgi:hypothetical protein
LRLIESHVSRETRWLSPDGFAWTLRPAAVSLGSSELISDRAKQRGIAVIAPGLPADPFAMRRQPQPASASASLDISASHILFQRSADGGRR